MSISHLIHIKQLTPLLSERQKRAMPSAQHIPNTTSSARSGFATRHIAAEQSRKTSDITHEAPADWSCASPTQDQEASVVEEIQRCLEYYIAHEEDFAPSLSHQYD
jgi:hypothetical protein